MLEYPLLIDGGLSNQLEKQGYNLDHPLWTAKLLKTGPEALINAHLAYIEAGAQCIASASYQASFSGYKNMGISHEDAKQLILRSVDLTEIAIERYLKKHPERSAPVIAASIGPYGAFLADGSEYRGDYKISDSELFDFHQEKIRILASSNADLLAFETIPSFREAKVIARILNNIHKKAWISFSCKNGSDINDGTSIADCCSLFANHPSVFALGVNCTKPQYISSLINKIKLSETQKKIIVYPNSGEAYNAATKEWINTSETGFYISMVKEWIECGADIIGGCCRIGPEQIKAIHKLISL